MNQLDQALSTTIEPPPKETPGLRVVRAESFRQDNDGDVMIKPFGVAAEIAIDDPLALLAVTMAAIKFGHGPEMLGAAQKLVSDFGKEPTDAPPARPTAKAPASLYDDGMVRGLARAAAMLEQCGFAGWVPDVDHTTGQLWDTTAATALAQARKLGLTGPAKETP